MQQELSAHVKELRWRLKHIAVVFTVLTGISFYFASDILGILQEDLAVELNALVAYEVFYTEIMIAFLFGFMISLPVFLYHFLKFVKPGLKPREYRVLRNYLPFSLLLFASGAVFAYQFIVKSSLAFFQSTTEAAGTASVWGLSSTLGFALKLSAFTGVMFQLPIAAMVLAKAGLIDSGSMVKYRTYFFLAVLLTAAMATPPDILTQLLVTLPVMALYQFSIFLVARMD